MSEPIQEPVLKEFSFKDGALNIAAEFPEYAVLMRHIADFFIGIGAENYVQHRMEIRGYEDRLGPLEVTVQRLNGKTPVEKLNDANAEIARLRKALEEISNWRFGYDGDCGVAAFAEKTLNGN